MTKEQLLAELKLGFMGTVFENLYDSPEKNEIYDQYKKNKVMYKTSLISYNDYSLNRDEIKERLKNFVESL